MRAVYRVHAPQKGQVIHSNTACPGRNFPRRIIMDKAWIKIRDQASLILCGSGSGSSKKEQVLLIYHAGDDNYVMMLLRATILMSVAK